jgi:DedD protein
MGLLSKLKFGAKAADKRAPSAGSAAEVVRVARLRARRRLIGAALLLGAGIIGFPLLFETQPRPIPVDIPIDIPAREGAAPLQPRSDRSAAVVVNPPLVEPTPSDADAREVIEPVVKPDVIAQPVPAAKPEPKADSKPAAPAVEKAADKPTPKPADKPVEKKPEPKVEAKPEPKPVAAKPAEPVAADSGRYVVQVGAFAEVGSARDARMKVEAMGLKTYTQVIESASGRRIRVRVGPFSSKAEAEKASVRIKLGGLPAAVLTL